MSEGCHADVPKKHPWHKARLDIWGSMLVSVVVVVLYGALYVGYIRQHTALPYGDESGYIQKTYRIADQHIHPWQPRWLLGVEPAVRPPLLPGVAAMLVGRKGSEQQIAIVWLVVRLIALVAGAAGIAGLFGRALLAPLILLLVLGTPFFMAFRGLYMMDQPFTCFVLPVFAALLYDDVRASWRSSGLVAATVIMLFLIKPAAPILVLPLCFVRGMRALWQWRGKRPALREWLPWVAGYAALGVVMALLLASPYGQASQGQYQLGMKGYWAIPLPWQYVLRLMTTMVPALVVAGVAVCAVFPRRLFNRWVALYGVAAVGWWMWFNFEVSYTTDERIAVNTVPIATAAVAVLMARRRWAVRAFGCVAAGLFGWNLLIAGHFVQAVDLGLWNYKVPVEATYCEPAIDPGCRKLVRALDGLLGTTPGDPESCVNIVFTDHYFDGAAILLAAREVATRRGKAGLQLRDWPIREEAFDFGRFLEAHWYVTQDKNKTYDGSRQPMFDYELAADRLLTDEQSPIRSALDAVRTIPILRPSRHDAAGFLYWPAVEDKLTVWHLKRELTSAEELASLEFVLPMFRNGEMRAQMGRTIEQMRREGADKTQAAPPAMTGKN